MSEARKICGRKGALRWARMLSVTLCVALMAAMLPAITPVYAAEPLNRPEDPVVLQGADVPSLGSTLATNLVAFRYTAEGWVQVPVQVDERKVVSYGAEVYNSVRGGYVTESYDKFTNLVYCDESTHVGADTNPCIDADDEIVFMARDAGVQAPEGIDWPAGVKPIRGVEITVTDPLAPNAAGYLYFFERASDSNLTSDAGVSYVSYEFKLQSGQSYKEAYPFTKAKNATQVGRPEDSTITTANYKYHFEDRWADDGLFITAGDATGVDILDRNKVAIMPSSEVPALVALFYDGDLSGSRTEDTFDGFTADPAEGAFICNIDGPIRAIRAFVGANSGPITQRNYFAYDSRMDIITNLRVHAMPSLMSFFDYSAAASGMKYYRDDATGGVTIDGSKDSLSSGNMSETELVTGAQGSLAMSTSVTTDITDASFTVKSYYLDDASSSPKDDQHTGDGQAYGSSGIWVRGDISAMMSSVIGGTSLEKAAEQNGIPNTDPVRSSSAKSLDVTKILRFRAPGMTFAEAQAATTLNKTPLTATSRAITNPNAGDIALWSAVYHKNGAQMGSVPVDYESYYVDSALTLPGNTGGLSRRGYKFIGWATSPTATEALTYYTATEEGVVNFYAVWERMTPYVQTGATFIDGAPSALFEEAFDYTDATTATNLKNSGKWSTCAEATSDGAFSRVYGGKMVFNGRKSSSSSPRLGVSLDPTIVAGGNTVTLTFDVRTGTVGKTQVSLYEGNTNVSSALVTLENGKISAKGSTTATNGAYTPSIGTYSAKDGDIVSIKLVIDFDKQLLSAYANDHMLCEGASLSALGSKTNLILMLHGSYGASADGNNWGEYDNIVLRQSGICLGDVVFKKNGVPFDTKLQNGTIEISRTLYNEAPTAYSAVMLVGVYNNKDQLTQMRVVPFDLAARSMATGTCSLTIQPEDAKVRVYFWKGILSMYQIVPMVTLTK